MKRCISMILILLFVVCLGSGCQERVHGLRGPANTQSILQCLSNGDIEGAIHLTSEPWNDAEVEARFLSYAELIRGQPIRWCSCLDYDIVATIPDHGNYPVEETTRYEVTLEDDTILYAQFYYVFDGNEVTHQQFELFENNPW